MYALVEGFGFAFTKSPKKLISWIEIKRSIVKLFSFIVLSALRIPFNYIFVLNSTDLILARKLTRYRVKVAIVPPLGGRRGSDDCVEMEEMKGRSGATRILFVGRLVSDKGYDLLVNLIDNISADSEFRDIHFTIYGDEFVDNPSSVHRSVVAKLRNSPLCDVYDFTPDLGSKLKQFDLLLMLSHREGASMVMQEAAHAGLPIVAHSAPGVRDFIIHGFNGILVDGSDCETLKSVLLDVGKRPEFYGDLAKNNKSVAHSIFQNSKHVDELGQYFNSL